MKKLKNLMALIAVALCVFIMTSTVTAFGANTVICDHNWILSLKEGSACSGYNYVYTCTKCYASQEKKTEPTQAHVWSIAWSEDATCTRDGFTNYYCEVCSALKKETTTAPGHSYTYASNNDATCTKDGTRIRRCQRCGDTENVPDPGSAKGHSFGNEWQVVVSADCINQGVSKRLCKECGAGDFRYDELTAHTDKDKDYKCDVCGESLSIFSPTLPDENTNKDCSCKCHKGGIAGFFWKIGNFFNKLFRIKSKQICGCGEYHY